MKMSTHKPNILSCDERVQIILSTVEEKMTQISRIGSSQTRVPLTPAAVEKRHREAREELRREVARLVRGRGRDMLSLVRQYVEENEEPGYDREHERVMVVYASELLSVIDAGFIAEDEPVAGERCPLCERGMTEHTRIDLYGTDAFLCSGATRDGVVSIAHPQALARLHDAAQREAQRQFDELTKGDEARRKAEDYARILDALAEVPAAQLEGLEWEEGGAEFAPVVRQLLTRGPLLERERLEAVVRDAVRQSLAPLNLQIVDLTLGIDEIDDSSREIEYAEAVAGLVANLLKALFPVRVEYISTGESERVERARKMPEPPVKLELRGPELFETLPLLLPPMVEGQTHWLIGNDYGLFYKVDAEGRVTRLENEHGESLVAEGDMVPPPGEVVEDAAAAPEGVPVECPVIDCTYKGVGRAGDSCPECDADLREAATVAE